MNLVRKGINMTEQVLRTVFDFQRFAHNSRLDELIEDTQSRQAISLSESELSYVNAAGVPGMMGLVGGGESDKDDPWNH